MRSFLNTQWEYKTIQGTVIVRIHLTPRPQSVTHNHCVTDSPLPHRRPQQAVALLSCGRPDVLRWPSPTTQGATVSALAVTNATPVVINATALLTHHPIAVRNRDTRRRTHAADEGDVHSHRVGVPPVRADPTTSHPHETIRLHQLPYRWGWVFSSESVWGLKNTCHSFAST